MKNEAPTGRTIRKTALLAALVLAAAASAAAVARQTAARDADDLRGWSRLTLGAQQALVLSATSTLDITNGSHPETGNPAIVLRTHSSASLLGAKGFEEETISYIDPRSHHPLEFVQIRPGSTARRFRFMGESVRQSNWSPPEGSPDAPFESWRRTEVSERKLLYPDGTPLAAGEWPTDFYSLIYLLRDLDLASDEASSREFTALYRRHLVRIVVTPGERRRNERTVRNDTTGKEETLRLDERAVSVRPVGEGADSFRGFLGMQGETRIWVDENSGAIVEIDGKAPALGATQVTLRSFRR